MTQFPTNVKYADVIIIGTSASGLMCAIEAGKRHRKVLVLDHANKAGKKILMSGGGRCNFTNYHIDADNFISHNPHFCKSALSRFTQWDFISLVEQYQIAYHERSHGQLFCDNSAKDILSLLLTEAAKVNVTIRLNTSINHVARLPDSQFKITGPHCEYQCQSLVIASGGLSIPTMGASPFGYQLAEQFGIKVWPTRAGLVPFTLQPSDKNKYAPLSGIAVDSIVSTKHQSFRENILFTHRGLSGPAILQISSYWHPGESVLINLLPDIDLVAELTRIQQQRPKLQLKTALAKYLPARLVATFIPDDMINQPLNRFSHDRFEKIAEDFQQWIMKPNATEGYRTAEVTLGGIDCDSVSSKTMESQQVPGLYFIGEVLDVTGWLGGYNFQWAWSSGWCAGQVV